MTLYGGLSRKRLYSVYRLYRRLRFGRFGRIFQPHLRDEFNAWLAPRFGEDLALEVDLDEIPALTLRREKTWARVRAAEFLTLNEKR